jgi:hypothetical protein
VSSKLEKIKNFVIRNRKILEKMIGNKTLKKKIPKKFQKIPEMQAFFNRKISSNTKSVLMQKINVHFSPRSLN